MWYMFVTLDVSRLSGWLNALAFYRAERRAYDAGGIRARRREGVGRRLCMQHTDEDSAGHRGRGTRGAHPKHIAHGCDTGRVKLSDWLNTNAPCRVEERTHKVGSMRAGIREGVWGGGGACSVQAKTQLGIGRRARAERTWNMSLIFVTLDVSRLSGWLNADAPCGIGAGCVVIVGQEGSGVGRGETKSVRGGPGGVWGTPGAHPKHLVHVRDAGGFPARDVRIERTQVLEELVHACDR